MIDAMMPCRYEWLERIMLGFAQTGGEPLIGWDGTRLVPFANGDDIGMYCLIPKLAHTFSVSLDMAIYLFFYGAISVSSVAAVAGFFLLYRSWYARIIACAGVALLCYMARVPDTYSMQVAVVMFATPLTLWFVRRNCVDYWMFLWLCMVGCAVGVANSVRAYAGLPVVLFVVVSILFGLRVPYRQKLMALISLAAGCLVPVLYFHRVYAHYVSYVATMMPGAAASLDCHVFWHAVYVGFGFLSNDFGIRYDDAVAAAKVCSRAPDVGYCSQEYELVLRNELFKLIIEQPGFVVRTLFAKFGVLQFFLIKFANVGLVAAGLYRKSLWIDAAFVSALAVASLPGFVAMPFGQYLLGFSALALLWGVVSVCELLAHNTRIQSAKR